jgi:hypothetical protein
LTVQLVWQETMACQLTRLQLPTVSLALKQLGLPLWLGLLVLTALTALMALTVLILLYLVLLVQTALTVLTALMVLTHCGTLLVPTTEGPRTLLATLLLTRAGPGTA